MIVQVPAQIETKHITAPASKSYAQRAIFAASLGHSSCVLKNLGKSDDVRHILQIAAQLGAKLNQESDGTQINPRKNEIKRNLNCGESGLGIRLTTSIATTFGGEFLIEGKGSLKTRPMHSFNEFLPKMGVSFESNNGFVPLKIRGRLLGGAIDLDGSMSSQFLSGLLMALPLASNDSIVQVSNLVSAKYVDMTIGVMRDFGIKIVAIENKTYTLKGKQEYTNPTEYYVEGDWSGATFWIVSGAINESIKISGLNQNSLQADRAILEVLDLAGVTYEWNNEELEITSSAIKPFEFDATNCPDLFPILATLAAATNGTTKIHGVHRLKNKESDRGLTVQKEFGKLGLEINLEKDTMIIHGSGKLNSATIHANHDHRIAMACAIASCLTPNGVEIENAEAVGKSYPEFWTLIEKVKISE